MEKSFFSKALRIISALTILFSCAVNEPASGSSKPQSYKSETGPYKTSVIYTSWTDTARSWDDNGVTVQAEKYRLRFMHLS